MGKTQKEYSYSNKKYIVFEVIEIINCPLITTIMHYKNMFYIIS